MEQNINVLDFFDSNTATFTYLIFDCKTKDAAVIDPVLDFDRNNGQITTKSIDCVIDKIKELHLNVKWILETHIHADHITASSHLKRLCGGKIAIGENIKKVLEYWVPVFNTYNDTPLDGSQFDLLLKDGDCLALGRSNIEILHTPGHTPACVTYKINGYLFVGDTIFMPDIGTARTDFPGASTQDLYQSIQRILSFPNDTKICVGHDYPPDLSRSVQSTTTVYDQKHSNILIAEGVLEKEYTESRAKRDLNKPVPQLLFPSIQMNMRAGELPQEESNHQRYIKIPLTYSS